MGKRWARVINLRNISALLPGRKAALLKTLIIYIVIGTFLIALLSTLLYTRFSANSIREINKVSTDSLQQSMRTFDKLWEVLYLNMKNKFFTDTILLNGMELTEFNPLDSKEISKALGKIIDTNNAIDSVYLYNSKANAIFSNFGTVTTCDNFYDKDIADILNNRSANISQISDCAVLYRKMIYSYGSVNQSKNVITVIFSMDDMKTALIFNIDQNMLQNLIAPQDSTGMQSSMIVNKQGVVVSDSEPSKIYTNIAGEGYGRKILDASTQSSNFIDKVNGRKCLITYSHWDKWDTLGWVFVNIADYDSLIGDLKQLQNSILLITSLFVIASLTAAVLIFGNVFRPFYRLIELLRTRNPYEPAQMNEIEYLGHVYSNMANDLDSLNIYKASSRPVLKNEFLNRLIHGEISSIEDAVNQAAGLSIKLDTARFKVVTFRLDKTIDGAPGDMALLKFTACGITAEQFSPMVGEVMESGDDNISVILDADSPVQLVEQAARAIQESCLRLLKLSFTTGIGTAEDGITGIQYSYRNAMEATQYRLVYGQGVLIDYAAEAASRQLKYTYPIDMEKDLLEAVRAADSGRFASALRAFVGSIAGYAYDEILLAMSQMALMLTRTLKAQLQVTHMQEAGIGADIREIDSVIRSSDTMDEISQWLLNYFERCMETLRLRKSSKYNEVMDSIQKYISENYCDASLTVEMIADHVNLSPNYMRTLFKDHTGMTVSHYLNEFRFKIAAELLVSTAHPASRIAGMVGFQEGSYFYSAFKNSTGMSPEEYRKSNKPALQ